MRVDSRITTKDDPSFVTGAGGFFPSKWIARRCVPESQPGHWGNQFFQGGGETDFFSILRHRAPRRFINKEHQLHFAEKRGILLSSHVPWSQVGRVRFYSDTPRYQSLTTILNDADDTFSKASEFLVSIRFISRGIFTFFFFLEKHVKYERQDSSWSLGSSFATQQVFLLLAASHNL